MCFLIGPAYVCVPPQVCGAGHPGWLRGEGRKIGACPKGASLQHALSGRTDHGCLQPEQVRVSSRSLSCRIMFSTALVWLCRRLKGANQNRSASMGVCGCVVSVKIHRSAWLSLNAKSYSGQIQRNRYITVGWKKVCALSIQLEYDEKWFDSHLVLKCKQF